MSEATPIDRDPLLRRVAAALTRIREPGGEDVVSSGRVRELDADAEGVVRFRFVLHADDPATLVREARAAAEGVEGVTKVRVDVRLPSGSGQGPAAAPSAAAGGQPQGGHAHGQSPLRPGSVPAPTPDANLLPGVEHIVAVSSGKGGVGKSTVAANLAVALAQDGLRVGVLDADVYGPNIPLMFGESRRPDVTGEKGKEKIVPLEAHGVKLMSLGFLLDEAQPAIMRGPMIAGILKQFLDQVEWGELDVLVVDMPPGTGDAQLSLVQTVRVNGVVMVTTPQEVAVGDVKRAIRMFERVNTRVLGVIENMSGFTCPCCGESYDLFGKGGGRRLAEQSNLALLAEIPLDPVVRSGSDEGQPVVLAAPDSPAGSALRAAARSVLEMVGGVPAAEPEPVA